MNKLPLIYIASPYTKGDPCINARFQMHVFDRIIESRLAIPYAPLIAHYQHTVFPRPYNDWIDYGLAMLGRCDAVLSLDATFIWPDGTTYLETQSNGREMEEAYAKRRGLPIYYSIHELFDSLKKGELKQQ